MNNRIFFILLNFCFLFLQPDETELFNFVSGYPSWADYLTSMGEDGTWGDHVILYAAANCYETKIRVISLLLDHPDVIINPRYLVGSTKALVLGHIQEVHYVSLPAIIGKAKHEFGYS